MIRWALISLFASSCIAFAGERDLEFNMDQARKEETFNGLVASMQVCMFDASKAMLYQGARDSDLITAFTVRVCSGPFVSFYHNVLGSPKEEGELFAKAAAYRELDRVPGVARAPRLDPQKKMDADLKDCIEPEIERGNYSSLDGGKSTASILTKVCRTQWSAWVRGCMRSGETKEMCVAQSVGIVQLDLKARGK